MVVDFHSHILPGIDDGSRNPAESIAMLRRSAEQGIREIILTPHFYPMHMKQERFFRRRSRSMEALLERLGDDGAVPKLRCGAEVYFYPQMSHSDALQALAIEGTRHILVEMPMGEWTDSMYRELENIYHNQGLTPIVAHVDRYLGWFRDYGIPDRLAELPVLVQANASSLLHGGKCMKLLQKHRIHLLGSDCHNLKDRKPNLGPAVERITNKLGKEAIAWIRRNEQKVLGSGEGVTR